GLVHLSTRERVSSPLPPLVHRHLLTCVLGNFEGKSPGLLLQAKKRGDSPVRKSCPGSLFRNCLVLGTRHPTIAVMNCRSLGGESAPMKSHELRSKGPRLSTSMMAHARFRTCAQQQ
ncbi:unnamed protein product, partial [Scytosiphon promiscuus]